MYYLIQYGILVLISTYLVLTYAAPSVSTHIKFWSILTWTLNFSLALLVPEDVYLTMLKPEQGTPQYRQKQIIAYEYLILYWSVYLLTWTIIPILQGWENFGDLESSARLKRSFKYNAVYYMYMLLGGILVILILLFFEVGGDMGLMTWLKCLATVWGILLQMVMMGYAMVQIPRSLWLETSPSQNLKYSYIKIADIEEQRNEAVFEFKQVGSFITYIKQDVSPKTSERQSQKISLYYKQSFNLVPQILKQKIPSNTLQFMNQMSYLQKYPFVITEDLSLQERFQKDNNIVNTQERKNSKVIEYLIEHHRLMKRILARHKRLIIQLDEHFRKAILCQDIISNSIRGSNQLSSIVLDKSKRVNFVWNIHIKPILYKILAILLSLFSFVILISETQIFLGDKSSTTLLGWMMKIENLEVLRVVVFFCIGFIAYMVYYSLFRLKLSNIYGLYKHNSDGPSLMFATTNFSRVGVAIVLNFLNMLKLEGIYIQVMGTVEMGLIGEWIIKGLPGVLFMIVLFHYLNIWGKLIGCLKLSDQLKFQSHQVPQESDQGQQNESLLQPGKYSWTKSEVIRYRRELEKKPTYSIFTESGL